MPAQLGINGFDRIEMLMFRATSAKPGVIMVTVHDPPPSGFSITGSSIQVRHTITSVGSWTLRVVDPSFVAMSRHLSAFVGGEPYIGR